MKFAKPFKAYWAESNVEAHLVVQGLSTIGVEAFADEDVSGASLWGFGRIGQFHQPIVWIDESDAERAAAVVKEFEDKKQALARANANAADIEVPCEECEAVLFFPAAMNGTTQDCSQCGAYIDVGDWDDDYEEAEE